MAGLTPKLPLTLGGDNGNYKLIKTYKNLIKQNFKNLILTAPGERIMDPNFGVGIRNFLFENDGELLYSGISEAIERQIQTYMPFIAIIDISFSNPSQLENQGIDTNLLSLSIEYEIVPLDTVDILAISAPRN
jgi:phage baseplate assembly protein W|tara:strand:- start:6810 stop:7208 length:399 start_codon:yes stop_codon:yes gene_type:complete